jgi:hypothetical protein
MTTSLKRLLLAVVVTAATCSLLNGCGDERDDSHSSEPTTRSQAPATVNGSGFTVQMPDKPKRSSGTVKTPNGPVKITLYVVERDDEAYALSVGKMPAGVEPDLDGAIDGAAANVHGTVAERKNTEYHGFPARDATITDAEDAKGNKGTVFVRVIGAGDRYYQLQYLAEGADLRAPAAG